MVLSTLFCCGSNGDKSGDIDYKYELMSMQERGRIDSTIMTLALSHSDSQIRDEAARTCGVIKDKRFISLLNSMCEETRPEISSIIFALGEIGDSTATDVLLPLIHSDEQRFRSEAVTALGKLGHKSAADRIRPFLLNDEFDSSLPLALWRLGDTLSIPSLRKMAIESETNDSFGAFYALFRLAPDSAVGVFVNALARDADSASEKGTIESTIREIVQPIAARGLGDGKDTTAILQAFDNHYDTMVRNAKVELIRAMGKNKAGRERLEKILMDTGDNGIKSVILTALGQIENAGSLDSVIRYLDDPSLQVRLAAIASLPQTNKRKSLKYLTDLSSDSLWLIRAETARALGKVGIRAAERRLKEMLADSDRRVKAAVIEGMGEYSVLKNIDIFEAALFGSTDIVVRSIAADVLGNAKKKKAFELLTKAAAEIDSSESVDFCRSLVTALGYYVDSTEIGQAAVEAINPFLNHDNRIVRQDAAAALKVFAPADFDPGVFDASLDRKYYNFMRELIGDKPVARMNTSRGQIIIKLLPEKAPRTVANFVKLAGRKFYDGLTFHRVIQNFVVQAGCPRGDGWGDPGYMIREEINSEKFAFGSLGMATSGRDTGGSQFFICLSGQPHLDGRYTVFGIVTDGWDALLSVELGDTIYSVTIERGR